MFSILIGTLLILAVLVVVGLIVVQFFQSRKTTEAERIRVFKAQLLHARKSAKIAERGLRSIASGSTGNPVLEAQIALDAIEELDLKELS